MISGLGIDGHDVLGIIPAPFGHSALRLVPQNWRQGVAPSRFRPCTLRTPFPVCAAYAADDGGEKFIIDFVAAWVAVMNRDRP